MQFCEYGCIFYFDLYIYFYVDVIRDRAYPLQQHYVEINIYPVKFVILEEHRLYWFVPIRRIVDVTRLS